jgi:hypothetical protein
MNRRVFLARMMSAAASGSAARWMDAQTALARAPGHVLIEVDQGEVMHAVPPDFTGLGYETASLGVPGLLSATNERYVELVRGLGASGILRIGGNTSDDTLFEPDGVAKSSPKGTVVNANSLKELRSFLDAVEWKTIWGLNLGSGTMEQAVEEAAAVNSIVGPRLHSFEIGNEPDLYRGRRPLGWNYDTFLQQQKRFKAAIQAKMPNAHFSGPDAAGSTDWVERFAHDEGSSTVLLTEHYYIGDGRSSASTISRMLEPDEKLTAMLKRLQGISTASHIPYRICETNSFYNGGRAGVSDTLGAALWTLDYMFTLCSAGAAGVNIETGVNQYGVVSPYSPIAGDAPGTNVAKASYYGMLAFGQASRGQQVVVQTDSGGINVTAYAVSQSQRKLVVTVINKDLNRDVTVTVRSRIPVRHATAQRLEAPSPESKEELTFGGVAVGEDGRWQQNGAETMKIMNGSAEVRMKAASAALLTLAT